MFKSLQFCLETIKINTKKIIYLKINITENFKVPVVGKQASLKQ